MTTDPGQAPICRFFQKRDRGMSMSSAHAPACAQTPSLAASRAKALPAKSKPFKEKLVNIAPAPILARLERSHYRVACGAEMFCRVLVL